MSTQRKIACLVFPDVMSLDVTGPVQVFASANVELQRQGRAAVYQPLLLGESLEPVASSCGIRLGVDACWHDLAPAELDTLLVPGGQGVDMQRQNPALLAWLRRATFTPFAIYRLVLGGGLLVWIYWFGGGALA